MLYNIIGWKNEHFALPHQLSKNAISDGFSTVSLKVDRMGLGISGWGEVQSTFTVLIIL